MSTLTHSGFLEKQHQSAGRVPTAAGLRLYIDRLMAPRSISAQQSRDWAEKIDPGPHDTHELIRRASNALASVCHMAAIGRYPCLDDAVVQSIEFTLLGQGRTLVILTLDNGEVHHRIVDLTFQVEHDDLKRACEQFNGRWSGCALADIRRDLRHLVARKAQMASTSVIMIVRTALASLLGDPRIVVAGRSNVLRADVGLDHASSLLKALDDQELLLELLDGLAGDDCPQVLIGRETQLDIFEPFTLVAAPYRDQHNRVGRLAIVGPVRMDYSKAMSWVSYAARAMSSVLDQGILAAK